MAEPRWLRIGDICSVEKGVTGLAAATPGEYPLVATGAERRSAQTYQFDTPAVCIPLVSSTGHGKKTLNYVHFQEGKFALGTILAALIPKDKKILDARYLHTYLQMNKDRVLVPLMRGAANVSLSVSAISDINIPVPPLTEQKKALSKLDSMSGEHAELLIETDKQLELLKQLRLQILQDAIEGKLTADWRKKNPALITGENHASKLLEKIKSEKSRLIQQGELKNEKPLPPITEAEKPFPLPEGWTWCRLGALGLFGRGKSKHRPRNDSKLFNNGTYPFIQTGDVSSSKKTEFKISGFDKQYNDFGLAQSKLWPKGTLCITIAANIAETGFLDIDACFPDSVVGFTSLSEGSTPWLVKYYLEAMQTEIIKFAPATAQKNINLDIIGALLFPLPPLSEHRRIVDCVNKTMDIIRELEAQVAERKNQAEMLMQSVLREAFEDKQAV